MINVAIQPMAGQSEDFSHLDRTGRAVAGVGLKPRFVVLAALTGAVLLAWLLLAGMAIRSAQAGLAGAGNGLLQELPAIPLLVFWSVSLRCAWGRFRSRPIPRASSQPWQ